MNNQKNLTHKFILLVFVLYGWISHAQDKKAEANSKEEVAFAVIEKAPHPKSCKVYENDPKALKQCFTEYISEQVRKNFRMKKFKNYPPKKYRVAVQFKIDTDGNIVDILARGADEKIEKEAIRVIKKVPRLIPGVTHGKKVSVLYAIPINFIIPNKSKK
ncbi:energy transducer TonB [Flavobacteriaceae bacterium 14752]|uniref:energy transducer TonB n=1 Tax=Mesohalobacter salilacus TaxID=2491711 RepID=UPI000F63A7F5|nr:hypothetical protein EIG84_07785 [Flavobacteriaceae bacterium 14752]